MEYERAIEALERATLAETDECRILKLVRALELLKKSPCTSAEEFAIAGIPLSQI